MAEVRADSVRFLTYRELRKIARVCNGLTDYGGSESGLSPFFSI